MLIVEFTSTQKIKTLSFALRTKQDQGSKAPSGHSSFYLCLPFYQVYLSILAFAPSTFLPCLSFYQVYLLNLSFTSSSLPIKPIIHSISPFIHLSTNVYLSILSFAPFTFLPSLPIEPIIRSI